MISSALNFLEFASWEHISNMRNLTLPKSLAHPVVID